MLSLALASRKSWRDARRESACKSYFLYAVYNITSGSELSDHTIYNIWIVYIYIIYDKHIEV